MPIESSATAQAVSDGESGEDVVFGLYLVNRAMYEDDPSSPIAPTLNLSPSASAPQEV
jgi:hypothetical protein